MRGLRGEGGGGGEGCVQRATQKSAHCNGPLPDCQTATVHAPCQMPVPNARCTPFWCAVLNRAFGTERARWRFGDLPAGRWHLQPPYSCAEKKFRLGAELGVLLTNVLDIHALEPLLEHVPQEHANVLRGAAAERHGAAALGCQGVTPARPRLQHAAGPVACHPGSTPGLTGCGCSAVLAWAVLRAACAWDRTCRMGLPLASVPLGPLLSMMSWPAPAGVGWGGVGGKWTGGAKAGRSSQGQGWRECRAAGPDIQAMGARRETSGIQWR